MAAQTISGNVTDEVSGSPLAGIDIDVFDLAGKPVTVTGDSTDALGDYTVTLPGAGTYTVRADASVPDGVADEFYDNVFLKSGATPIVVGASDNISDVDFALPPGVLISGTVSASGAPLGSIDIDLFAITGEFIGGYSAFSFPNGAYGLGAVPPGTYFVRADPDPAQNQFFQRTFHNSSTTLAGATPVVVGGSNVSNIDIALVPGGTIAGLVVDIGTFLPLAGFDLDIFEAGTGLRVDVTATTSAGGAYEIGPVAAGQYLLRVDPTLAQGYTRKYYRNSISASGGVPITVNNGARTPNINFGLGIGGTISGTIRELGSGTPLFDIDLDCFDDRGKRLEFTTKTDISGNYRLGPLPAGSYFVRADPSVAQGYAEQGYIGVPDVNLGTPVPVTAGADTPGIDFDLPFAAAITGTVTNALAQPLANIDMDIFDAATNARLRSSATTAADGTYAFNSLMPGQYKVRADANLAQGFALLYFNGRDSAVLADPVNIAAGSTTSGIDFTLMPGASIAGIVRDPAAGTSVPIANLDIDVLTWPGLVQTDQGDFTASDGAYTIVGLPPGQYLIRADATPGKAYDLTYYNGVPDTGSATVITLAAGQNLAGVDFLLPQNPALVPVSGLTGWTVLTLVLLVGPSLMLIRRRRTRREE